MPLHIVDTFTRPDSLTLGQTEKPYGINYVTGQFPGGGFALGQWNIANNCAMMGYDAVGHGGGIKFAVPVLDLPCPLGSDMTVNVKSALAPDAVGVDGYNDDGWPRQDLFGSSEQIARAPGPTWWYENSGRFWAIFLDGYTSGPGYITSDGQPFNIVLNAYYAGHPHPPNDLAMSPLYIAHFVVGDTIKVVTDDETYYVYHNDTVIYVGTRTDVSSVAGDDPTTAPKGGMGGMFATAAIGNSFGSSSGGGTASDFDEVLQAYACGGESGHEWMQCGDIAVATHDVDGEAQVEIWRPVGATYKWVMAQQLPTDGYLFAAMDFSGENALYVLAGEDGNTFFNPLVYRINATLDVTTFVNPGFAQGLALHVDTDSHIYVVGFDSGDVTDKIKKYNTSGTLILTRTLGVPSGDFAGLSGGEIYADGSVYVYTFRDENVIRRFDMVGNVQLPDIDVSGEGLHPASVRIRESDGAVLVHMKDEGFVRVYAPDFSTWTDEGSLITGALGGMQLRYGNDNIDYVVSAGVPGHNPVQTVNLTTGATATAFTPKGTSNIFEPLAVLCVGGGSANPSLTVDLFEARVRIVTVPRNVRVEFGSGDESALQIFHQQLGG